MPLRYVELEESAIVAVLEVLTSPEGSALVRSGEGKVAVGYATLALQNAPTVPEEEPEVTPDPSHVTSKDEAEAWEAEQTALREQRERDQAVSTDPPGPLPT